MDKQTLDYAKEYLTYCPETGLFYWVKMPKKLHNKKLAHIGSQAGSAHHSGYLFITLLGKKVASHRLAWAWVHGEIDGYIDHVNGVKADNRIENLRLATRHQNSYNVGLTKSNTSGHKNVQWDKDSNKWRVRIRVDGKRHHVGRFADKEQAVHAANEFMLAYHKEFARIE